MALPHKPSPPARATAHHGQGAPCQFALYRLWRQGQGHTLLYGPRLGCTRIAATLAPGEVLGYEWLASLEVAESRAVAIALALRRGSGLGVEVQVMTVRDWDLAQRRARGLKPGPRTGAARGATPGPARDKAA